MPGYEDAKYHTEFHRPRVYRYVVADPGLRFVLNRYPGTWIGVALVAGRYAYCLKWANAGRLKVT